MTRPALLPALAVFAAILVSGCCDCTDSPAPESAQAADGVEFHPEVGLRRFSFYGTIRRAVDGSVQAQVQLSDSAGRNVRLREGDRFHVRLGASDSTSRTGAITLPKIAVGDSLVFELALRDSGSVFRSGFRVPARPVLVPSVLVRDTLLEVAFDSSWTSVSTWDSIAVLGPIGNVLTGVGRLSVSSGSIYGSTHRSVGAWFVDLRSMVRLAATAGKLDSLYLKVGSGSARRDIDDSASRVRGSLTWLDDFEGEWRIPLGI